MCFRKTFFALFLVLFAGVAGFSQSVSRPIADMVSAKAVSTNKIKVSWKLQKSPDVVSVLIYKNTEPFSAATIESSSPVAGVSPEVFQYIDTVKDFNEYYYAVLAKLKDGSVYKIILPSINATVKGVKVERPATVPEKSDEQIEREKPKIYTDGTMRERPLPYIDLIEDFEKKPNQLKPEVIEAGRKLAEGERLPKEKLLPHYFDEDLVSPAGGDDYYLFDILKTYFVKKNYKAAVPALQKFLSINRSEHTTNRAVFYLAESQYFLGNYRHALSMFLFVEDAYPVLCKKWINSTLDFYTIPSD